VRLVVAIGGNALTREDQRGTWEEQLENAGAVARQVAELGRQGHQVILTHGNGPQVGSLHVQQGAAWDEVPALPLHSLGAMTQGQLGYLLETAIGEVDPELRTASVLTRVRVEPDDPAFDSPTKAIGRFYSEEEAQRIADQRGWRMEEDAGRGWRAVVASPRPVEIVELEQIRALSDGGSFVIAAGGGGIPVVRGEDGALRGVEAVIDKDRCSAELALALGAELIVLLTGVERVALDFGTRWQRDMARLTVSDAVRLLGEGEFPAGSMGPKVESAEHFVAGGGRAAIVTTNDRLLEAVAERDGTWIVADEEGPSAAASPADENERDHDGAGAGAAA
jgi:carbamate kinase